MLSLKHILVILLLVVVLSATTVAQELLPLSGDPEEKEWTGKERGNPYKIKPFEIQPRSDKNAKPEKIEEPVKVDEPIKDKPPIETVPENNKENVDEPIKTEEEIKKSPTPKDKNWIKGKFFGFEKISEEQPGIYGNYDDWNLNVSIILAEGGFFTYEHPTDWGSLDRNYGFGKFVLQVDVPVVDYWILQIGVGALTCIQFDTLVDSMLTNIEIVEDSNKYGWLLMGGTSVLLEMSKYIGVIPWGQFYYGNAGFSLDKYVYTQIRGGLRCFIQATQTAAFAVFVGPSFNSISINFDDETQTSAGLAIEGGFMIANVIILRGIYGFEGSYEFRFSIGTAF